MSCQFKTVHGLNAAARRMNNEYGGDKDVVIRELAEGTASLMSMLGSKHLDSYLNDYEDSYADMDTVVRYITNDNHKDLDSLLKASTDDVKVAAINEIKRLMLTVIEDNLDASKYNGLDKVINSSVALKTIKSIQNVVGTGEVIDSIPLLRNLNNSIKFMQNPIVAFAHWKPGKDALVKIQAIETFSDTGYKSIANGIKKILDAAEQYKALKDNNITRNDINKMLPVFDGADPDSIADVANIKSILTTKFDIGESVVDDVYEALDNVRRNWNVLNYGESNPSLDRVKELSINPRQGTVLGFYKALHDMVSSYHKSVSMRLSGNEDVYLDEVGKILEITTLQDRVRTNYMPTANNDLWGDIKTLEDANTRLIQPGMYRPKEFFSGEDGESNFELTMSANLSTNMSMFTKALWMVARASLDHESKLHLIEVGIDNSMIGSAVREANLVVNKLDKLIDYNPSNQTNLAKHLKRTLGTIGSIHISGMLMAPRSAVNNIVGGSMSAILAGIVVGSHVKLQDMVRGNPEATYLYNLAMSKSANLESPGIASAWESVDKNLLDKVNSGGRKLADWMGDGGFLRGLEAWKANATVKGSETYHLRSRLPVMVYLELSEKMKLSGLEYGTKEYNDYAEKLIPDIAVAAWTDLSVSLGHFNPLNKPLWAHIAFDTAETAPQVALAFFTKMFYTFRHVLTTNIDNLSGRIRNVAGGGYYRWDYTDNPNAGNLYTNRIFFLKQRDVALGGAVGIALFELFREFFKKDEPETALGRVVDTMARYRVPVINSANPIQGLDDFVKYLAFASGVANVDEATYERYKESSLRFMGGIAAGRELNTLFGDDAYFIKGLTNIVSREADWMKLFSDDIIKTGYNGSTLKQYRREYRADTAWFRQSHLFDVVSTLLIDTAMIGLKESDDPKMSIQVASDNLKNAIGRWIGLSWWNEDFDGSSRMRNKYLVDKRKKQILNMIKQNEYASARRNFTNPYHRKAYDVYASRARIFYNPPKPMPLPRRK